MELACGHDAGDIEYVLLNAPRMASTPQYHLVFAVVCVDCAATWMVAARWKLVIC